ncbi:PilZ domain-containing protein [Desulfurobacterium thermolithotrophum]|uniref:PilZ domain-containing protein n=1 Tax=Desulfurobacterium thermolithotrophum TaxID=64160 RepID=UPI0002DC346D|nr:PilZ domain-containing protein [Desulfurobacterium thermolithotrophum]
MAIFKHPHNLKKEKDKEVGEAFTRIFNLLKDKEVPIMLITFYKEVPVSCKALIDNVLESRIFVSFETCSYMKTFYDSSFIYLKITNAPKPIKAKKVDIFPEKKTIILEDFSFEEIPQERRKFVRVEPEEKFVVTVVKDNYSIKGIVADVSIGGIGVFFKTKPELSLGDKVEVNFILKGTPLSIEGEVRYVIKQGEVYRAGIEFKLQPKQEEIIAEYVMQRQFEILKELKMM